MISSIDLRATGRAIKDKREAAGLTVQDVQNYFGFEYPQAVYKWQQGKSLPSVDNLLALSRLLRVPMEDLLVYEGQEVPLVFLGTFQKFSSLKYSLAKVLPHRHSFVRPYPTGVIFLRPKIKKASATVGSLNGRSGMFCFFVPRFGGDLTHEGIL